MAEVLTETRALILRPGYRPRGVLYELPAVPSFGQLQKVLKPVLCGDLERVRVWHEEKYLDMFVDDDSIAKMLPPNEAATAIYRANVLAHQKPTPDLKTLPFVRGPAVLFYRQVWF